MKLIGECGTDLRAWPSAKHFTSWLCLAPGNKISGGRCYLHAEIIQPGSSAVAVGGHDYRYGAQSILSSAVLSCRQSEGRDATARKRSCSTTPSATA
ncbi:IS110 family transposase [Mesorhizobium sp. M0074]|uniref:transposase n=1 Tax=Mesorhizobium sp. M0074 TaxID=2956869 RepID=UPI003337F5A3